MHVSMCVGVHVYTWVGVHVCRYVFMKLNIYIRGWKGTRFRKSQLYYRYVTHKTGINAAVISDIMSLINIDKEIHPATERIAYSSQAQHCIVDSQYRNL